MAANSNPKDALIPGWVGNHPFSPKEKKPFLISREQELPQTFGMKEGPIFSELYFSTDRILLAEFTVAPGGYFTIPDVHAGDEVYYCREGAGVVFNPETGQTIEMKAGDALLIPKETRHQAFNFTAVPFVVVCAIAPQGWATNDGMGTAIEYQGKFHFYKA